MNFFLAILVIFCFYDSYVDIKIYINLIFWFQAERESLRKQVEQLQRDLAATGDTHNKQTGRIHELEKDNVILKNKVDEAVHKNKVEMTNQKMDMLKQRGELERERDKLANVIEGIT